MFSFNILFKYGSLGSNVENSTLFSTLYLSLRNLIIYTKIFLSSLLTCFSINNGNCPFYSLAQVISTFYGSHDYWARKRLSIILYSLNDPRPKESITNKTNTGCRLMFNRVTSSLLMCIICCPVFIRLRNSFLFGEMKC